MVFVTGGNGFIGRYVVRQLLREEKQVLVLVRDKEKYHQQGNEIVLEGSLHDMNAWKKEIGEFPVDACIHLAWEGIPDYSYDMSRKNLEYGLSVLDLCREYQIRKLVIAGSCWEYDNPHGATPVDAPIGFDKPFQAAKNSLRIMAHALCHEYGMQLHWLRLFYVYGPGQRREALLPYIIRCFREGRQPSLNGAYNRNDFVYVADVADAITMAIRNEKIPEILNIGNGKSMQVLSLVEIVAELLGVEFHAEAYKQNFSKTDFWADVEQDFPWHAKTSMREGICNMIYEGRQSL